MASDSSTSLCCDNITIKNCLYCYYLERWLQLTQVFLGSVSELSVHLCPGLARLPLMSLLAMRLHLSSVTSCMVFFPDYALSSIECVNFYSCLL
jgi:hypothetical protein